MKKTVIAVVLFALLTPTLALAGEWTGWITDAQCGIKGGKAKAGHAACAKKCYDKGSKLVLYTGDEKLYALDNQELAAKNIGHEVTVKGEAEGNAIKVAGIEPTADHANP